MKEYKTIWWEVSDEEFEPLDDIMFKNKGWEIFKMFLVYTGDQEAYRIVLTREKIGKLPTVDKEKIDR